MILVPREEVWCCMRKSGHVWGQGDCGELWEVGVAHGLEVGVGLHQGWALSPLLFGVVMDRMTDDIRQESLWTIVFADDSVICGENMEQVEERLEMHELKRGAEATQIHVFTYLGLPIQSYQGGGRVQAGWTEWKWVSGVIFEWKRSETCYHVRFGEQNWGCGDFQWKWPGQD